VSFRDDTAQVHIFQPFQANFTKQGLPKTHFLSKAFFFPLVASVVLSATGCSRDSLNRTSVQGTVLINGESVASGNIAFSAKPGTACPSIGGPIKDGRYSIPQKDGPVPGNFTVTISATKLIPGKIKDQFGNETDGMVPQSLLPAKYDRLRGGKEVLETKISEGKNIIDFELND